MLTKAINQQMELVVHTLCTSFSSFLLHIINLLFLTSLLQKVQAKQQTSFLASPSSLSPSLCTMERKRTLFERVRKNSTVVEEEMENEVEEEDGSGISITEEEKRKGVTSSNGGAGGRKGSSGGGGGVSPPSCQAERCGADLTEAKRYHRRHKVCEFHSKAPVVVVSGLRQRFCQQCSRFHDLAEFDESKRSCRRRLAGHNERRRKSNPEAANEGNSKGHHPKETTQHCRLADERGRIQMNLPGNTPGYKSFNIR